MMPGFWVVLAGNYLVAQQHTQSDSAIRASDSAVQSYVKEIDAWHARRIAALKKAHGWLSLIALDWLADGDNAVDSIGTVSLRSGKPFVEIDKRVRATLNGKEFTSGELKTDADSGGPEKIEIGSRAFIIIKRGERYAVREWDAASPARKNFTDIERFPVSLKWRIEARWHKYEKPKKVTVPSIISGYSEESTVPGVAIFTVDGKECRLEPIVDDPDSKYFIVFADKTNGKETYHAGRFLDTDPPKNGKIVLDFNKATDPPCAFTSYATCPLPPPQNHLDIRIEAGEKKYGDR
jgi:uncharacterized protein (DUF1684 family)